MDGSRKVTSGSVAIVLDSFPLIQVQIRPTENKCTWVVVAVSVSACLT